MKVLAVRNVNDALPLGLSNLLNDGVIRDSRNGEVLIYPTPVTTVYDFPDERVLFGAVRDANPFFHLYESLWMLAGRRDIAPLVRYAKQMAAYSDDGVNQHAAYGYRWRRHFRHPIEDRGMDQLGVIAGTLMKNKDDRRCVLQMWDPHVDLGQIGKDFPCNVTATFQINTAGELDLTVFCRSNDIIWGAYGANAVHMSILLEYMANWIEVPVGRLYQVSVNYHVYTEVLRSMGGIEALISDYHAGRNPYRSGQLYVTPLPKDHIGFDRQIQEFLVHEKSGFALSRLTSSEEPFMEICYSMFRAHSAWRLMAAPERYVEAMEILSGSDADADWIIAAKDWIQRRHQRWAEKIERV